MDSSRKREDSPGAADSYSHGMSDSQPTVDSSRDTMDSQVYDEIRDQERVDSQETIGPPLISVITPTWQRHELLLDRCIPSVQAQFYPYIEHIVVSDGPDAHLREVFQQPRAWHRYPRTWFFELPEHREEKHWGSYARYHGTMYATGQFVTYVDDDDALRRDHCTMLADALLGDPEAGFAVSRMMCHSPDDKSVTGWGPLQCGNVGTPMIMHRKSLLAVANWGPSSATEDWELVEGWLKAGMKYANVDAETSDVWPAMYR